MSRFPTYRQTFKNEILNLYSLTFLLISSFIYFSFTVFLLNYKLVIASFFGNYPLNFKINILYQLLIGSYSAFNLSDLLLLMITSILVGLNILFIFRIIKRLKSANLKLNLTVGGSTILGIVIAGCSSCGFSVLSLLGIAGALSFIPLGGIGLHLVTITLLIFSLIYSLKTYHQKIVCKIN